MPGRKSTYLITSCTFKSGWISSVSRGQGMWFQRAGYSMVNRGDVSLKYVKAPSFLAPPAQENARDHNNLLRSETSPKWMCRPGCTWWINQVGSWCQNGQSPWRGTALRDSEGKTEEQVPFSAYKKIAVLPVCAFFLLTDPYREMLPCTTVARISGRMLQWGKLKWEIRHVPTCGHYSPMQHKFQGQPSPGGW